MSKIKTLFKKAGNLLEIPNDDYLRPTHEQIMAAFLQMAEIISLKETKELPIQSEDNFKEVLEDWGFTNTKVGEKLKKQQEEFRKRYKAVEEHNVIVSAAAFFKEYYPDYKFITEAAIFEVCKKYNLFIGESEWFVGDIPDKNLEDMKNFRIDDEHACYVRQERDSMGIYHTRKHLNYRQYLNERTSYRSNTRTRKHPVMIAAPIADFDLTGIEINEETRELYKKPAPIDPVVFFPVQHWDRRFFLIITAWGPEAEDPLVKK